MRLNRRLQSVVRKEAREIYRDKLYLAMAFVVPVFLKILFGYGLTLDVKNIPTAVLDWNRSPASREYVDRVGRSRYFTLERYLLDYGPIYQGLLKGRLRLGLIIPPDFDRTLALGQETEVQALIDGSFPDRALTSRSYLEAINLEFNQELARRWQSSTGSMPPWIEVDTRAWFNSDLESKNFIVPGLMVTTLFFYPALLASIAIVREKESGSIFNIYCSPIRRWEYVIGKLLPYLGIGLINYVMIFLLSDYLFDVPFRGSFVFLTLAAVIYTGVSTAWGLLMSILFRTQVAAMLITMVTTMIPAFIYSGFFIAVNSMGPEAQFMAYILPATYFMELVRGVYLKGLGIQVYWSNLLILMMFLIIFLGLGIHRLKKRVG
ncbi:MAG: ABC transporter permease [Deltaproteobacteria bacterium]|nr:ABC transporter permease [Deltaproteobacteria bacterium]MBW1952189.1 ABC transporter permease [Deltaproteobacteria bacterium]MBW1985723.1 ABC transporter permease [Deltaproteobacteria bacterium]MBW2134636.1 ABC transporter permease [Deltaproteobacteria bacterium]